MSDGYLDWNATAPLRACARDAWLRAQEAAWANPASIHRPGQRARAALDAALAACAGHLGCRADELVAVSGGTEANATVIRGVLADGGPAAAAAIEHSSVLRHLPSGARILPVDGDGRLDPAAVPAGLRLLCVQLANNEIGTLQDVPALAAAAGGAWVHVDACQAAGKEPLRLDALGADSASIAGHKCGAPRGIGLLWLRRGRRLPPLLLGGRQQQDRRSGTEDAALVAALAAALGEAVAGLPAERERQRALVADCRRRLEAELPGLRVLGAGAPRLANTLGFVHPGIDGRHLAMRLDLAGFAVSTGAACLAGRGEPSHVVAALGLPADLARSFVRVSIGAGTVRLDGFAEACIAAVRALHAA